MEKEDELFSCRTFSEVKRDLDYLSKDYEKNKITILYLVKTMYYTVKEDIDRESKDVK